MKHGQIEVCVTDSYSPSDRLNLSGGDTDPSRTNAYCLTWIPKEKHVLILEDGRMVSHVGLVKRTVEVDGQPMPVAGVGGVLTNPEYRNRGFAKLAMQEAEGYACNTMGVDFGMLFCREALLPWYEGLGWKRVEETVWIEQPDGTVASPMVVMIQSLRQRQWPSGEVRLKGYPW